MSSRQAQSFFRLSLLLCAWLMVSLGAAAARAETGSDDPAFKGEMWNGQFYRIVAERALRLGVGAEEVRVDRALEPAEDGPFALRVLPWTGGRRLVVVKGRYELNDAGDKHRGIALYTYQPASGSSAQVNAGKLSMRELAVVTTPADEKAPLQLLYSRGSGQQRSWHQRELSRSGAGERPADTARELAQLVTGLDGAVLRLAGWKAVNRGPVDAQHHAGIVITHASQPTLTRYFEGDGSGGRTVRLPAKGVNQTISYGPDGIRYDRRPAKQQRGKAQVTKRYRQHRRPDGTLGPKTLSSLTVRYPGLAGGKDVIKVRDYDQLQVVTYSDGQRSVRPMKPYEIRAFKRLSKQRR